MTRGRRTSIAWRAKASSSRDFYANHANCSPTRTGFITGRYQQRYGIESPLAFAGDPRELQPSDTSFAPAVEERGLRHGARRKMASRLAAGGQPESPWLRRVLGIPARRRRLLLPRMAAPRRWRQAGAFSSGPLSQRRADDRHRRISPTRSRRAPSRSLNSMRRGRSSSRSAYNAPHWPFQQPDSTCRDSAAGRIRSWTGTRADYVAMLERADQGVGARAGSARSTEALAEDDRRVHQRQWRRVAVAQCAAVSSQVHAVGGRHPRAAAGPLAGACETAHDLATSRSDDGPHGLVSRGCGRASARQLTGRRGSISSVFSRKAPRSSAPSSGDSIRRSARRGAEIWKYFNDRGQHFLFDLSNDPGERHDLAQTQPALVRELRGLVAKWEADVDAEAKQRAAPKTQGGSEIR